MLSARGSVAVRGGSAGTGAKARGGPVAVSSCNCERGGPVRRAGARTPPAPPCHHRRRQLGAGCWLMRSEPAGGVAGCLERCSGQGVPMVLGGGRRAGAALWVWCWVQGLHGACCSMAAKPSWPCSTRCKSCDSGCKPCATLQCWVQILKHQMQILHGPVSTVCPSHIAPDASHAWPCSIGCQFCRVLQN